MKLTKTFINFDGHQNETYLAVYFEGNKEEFSILNKTIYLWANYQEDNELWLKIDVNDEKLFLSYLQNSTKLIDVLKDSKITLCKRYYKQYSKMESFQELEGYLDLPSNDIDLPDEKATLGYNFYSLLDLDKSTVSTKIIDQCTFSDEDIVVTSEKIDIKMTSPYEFTFLDEDIVFASDVKMKMSYELKIEEIFSKYENEFEVEKVLSLDPCTEAKSNKKCSKEIQITSSLFARIIEKGSSCVYSSNIIQAA